MSAGFIKWVGAPVVLAIAMAAAAYQLGRLDRPLCLSHQVDGGVATLRWSETRS